MQDVSWINLFKLRMVYGSNGNVAKMSLPQVIVEAAMNQYTAPARPSLMLLSYANSSLRWEYTNSFNIGLNYDIFRNIRDTVDFIREKAQTCWATHRSR